jgi:putative nucleotidyltransferase with HDIG domain
LAQPNQPLLRRLLTEAPGTYHHSIIVANLAERAAESIGADSLLVRVGAYYHDIGKMLRPGYFVENQIDGESPHTHLDPETSARVIKTHVTDGLALARQHRLPAKVQAFIPEHHGTRMAMYFYAMATKVDPDVPPEWFKYPGPIPQSRETAIVMLADSTEATVRANRDHSQESIERIIDQIIAERLQEGQLDDSGLTLGDLKRIRVAFMSVLRGVYHPRIEYPDPVKESSVAGRLSRLRRRPMALPATGNGAAGEPVGGTGPEVGPRPQPTSSS